jgi:hypothetical protein
MKKIKSFRKKFGVMMICLAILCFPVAFFTKLDDLAFYLFFAAILGSILCFPKNRMITQFQKKISNPQHPQNPHYRSQFYNK